ncbi:MAG TPA: hypothetical protein DD490_14760, partial [Acidobacteria bacterium]|nr:hypothetical protein [Acidobacteriota bacterium]
GGGGDGSPLEGLREGREVHLRQRGREVRCRVRLFPPPGTAAETQPQSVVVGRQAGERGGQRGGGELLV